MSKLDASLVTALLVSAVSLAAPSHARAQADDTPEPAAAPAPPARPAEAAAANPTASESRTKRLVAEHRLAVTEAERRDLARGPWTLTLAGLAIAATPILASKWLPGFPEMLPAVLADHPEHRSRVVSVTGLAMTAAGLLWWSHGREERARLDGRIDGLRRGRTQWAIGPRGGAMRVAF